MLFIPGSLIVHMLIASIVGLSWALVSATLVGVTKPGQRAALYAGALIAPAIGFFTHTIVPHDCGIAELAGLGHIACYTGSWLGDVGLLLVASGAVCVLSQSALSWIGYTRAVRHAMRADVLAEQGDEYALRAVATLSKVCQLAGVKDPELLLTEEDGVCCVVGVFRPSLLLSYSLCGDLEDDELAAVMAHEVGHIVRRDNAVGLVGALSRALAFFSPAMHMALKRYMVEREMACDDFAVEITGDSIALASGVVKVWKQQQGAPQLAAASIGGGSLSARIERLIDGDTISRPRPAGARVIAVVVLVLGVIILALC